MALHTKKEFASKCGLETKSLSVYILRKQVIVGDGNLIDDTNYTNDLFLQKCSLKRPKTTTKAPKTQQTKQKKGESDTKKTTKKEHTNPLLEFERRKKELEVQKLEQEHQLNQFKISRQQGEYVPVEQVKDIYSRFAKQYHVATQGSFDNLLQEIAQKTGMKSHDVAAFRSKLITALNEANRKAVEAIKKSVQDLQYESSEARSRGERKLL